MRADGGECLRRGDGGERLFLLCGERDRDEYESGVRLLLRDVEYEYDLALVRRPGVRESYEDDLDLDEYDRLS